MAIRSGGGAMSPIQLELQGAEELEKLLGDISTRSATNIMRNTLTDMARDVAKEMKRRAPKDQGILRKAIKAKRDRARPGQVSASVYITHGKGEKYNAFYWHMIENGTVDKPAQPFIRPSVEDFRQRQPQIMRDQFGKRYEKEMARLAKKGKK